MKRLTTVVMTTTLVFLLSGCTNYSALQKNVEHNNQQTSMVLTSYNKSKTQAVKLTPLVLKAIQSGDTQSFSTTPALKSVTGLDSKLTGYVAFMNKTIMSYISQSNNSIGILSGKNKSTLSNSLTFVNSVVKVHYFLNGSNGELNQMFLLELPSGFMGYFSIIWLGGDVVSVKANGLA